METYENEQRNQMGLGGLSTQQTSPKSQQQQSNAGNGMMSPRDRNMNEDSEEDMDEETMVDEEMDDDEMEKEDTMGTGGEMSRADDIRRGTMMI